MVRILLTIDGMACSMCESHMNNCIRKNFNIDKVTSSHRKGTCEIIAENSITEAALRAAIEPTGYKITGYSCESYEKKKKRFLFF